LADSEFASKPDHRYPIPGKKISTVEIMENIIELKDKEARKGDDGACQTFT